MKGFDQGLGVFGAIALAGILAATNVFWVPFLFSPDTIKFSDWLGLAGNILGAAMTLIAAIVAWRAVQMQINSQREAVLLDLMIREEPRIRSESDACQALGDVLSALGKNIVRQRTPGGWLGVFAENGLNLSEDNIRRRIGEIAGPALDKGVQVETAFQLWSLRANIVRLANTHGNSVAVSDLIASAIDHSSDEAAVGTRVTTINVSGRALQMRANVLRERAELYRHRINNSLIN